MGRKVYTSGRSVSDRAMADGSAPKPYPDADVDLVAEEIAESFNANNRACTIPADFASEARAVLDALAEAGRLLPEGVVQRSLADALDLQTFGSETLIDALHPTGEHIYWSTHCRHGRHEACSATEIRGVWRGDFARFDRAPAQCKTCGAPCVCPCHSGGSDG